MLRARRRRRHATGRGRGAGRDRRGWRRSLTRPTPAPPLPTDPLRRLDAFLAELSGPGYTVRNLGRGVVGATGAGLISALLGVGGGIIKVPLMHLADGRAAQGRDGDEQPDDRHHRGGVRGHLPAARPASTRTSPARPHSASSSAPRSPRAWRTGSTPAGCAMLFVVVLAYTAIQMLIKAVERVTEPSIADARARIGRLLVVVTYVSVGVHPRRRAADGRARASRRWTPRRRSTCPTIPADIAGAPARPASCGWASCSSSRRRSAGSWWPAGATRGAATGDVLAISIAVLVVIAIGIATALVAEA